MTHGASKRKPFLSSFAVGLFGHLPVNVQNEQSNGKVRYTEIHIPSALRTWRRPFQRSPVSCGPTDEWPTGYREKGRNVWPRSLSHRTWSLFRALRIGFRKLPIAGVVMIPGRGTLGNPGDDWPRKSSLCSLGYCIVFASSWRGSDDPLFPFRGDWRST